MKRREFLAGAGCMVLAHAARAQPGRQYRVGLIMATNNEDARRFLSAFVDGMKERGYEAGRDLDLRVRYYEQDRQRIPALADELIGWKADVLVANISSTAVVLKAKTAATPIVMVTAVDAVAEGLVVSLARPGGNVTGMTSLGEIMHAKLVELARELLPRASRIALLINPDHALSKSYETAAVDAAKARGLAVTTLRVQRAADLGRFEDQLAATRADALVVATDGVLFGLRDAIVQAALKAKLPAIALLPEFIASGAVATLGYDLTANYRGASRYVDRILKGAKPGELAVEQPMQFELVLNRGSAKALGLTIPQTLLVRADRVIE